MGFPEAIRTRAPRGTNALIATVCARHGVTLSEYLRLAVLDRLEADGVSLSPDFTLRRVNVAKCREAAR